jgi:ribosomal-protein-alanine N-acetyltransferase
MLIREWRKEDVEEIAVLEKECFSDPWTKEMLISSSLLSGFCGFVVEDNDKIVGYIGSTFIFEDSEVLLVAVKNSHRRKGLGKLLIETLTKKLKENQYQQGSLYRQI